MDKVLILGGTGLVGSAVKGMLNTNYEIHSPKRNQFDLLSANQVEALFNKIRPDYVFHCAAKVGGIMANIKEPAEFIYQNLIISSNIIHTSYKYNVKKLINLGSSCIYPITQNLLLSEEILLSGRLEPTNEYYALAKIAAIKMCEAYNKQYGTNFVSIMPPNLFGPNDNFDLETSHFIPAMIRKFSESDNVVLWGRGRVSREVMYSEDLAKLLIHIMFSPKKELNNFTLLNIGVGVDYTIEKYATLIRDVVNPTATISWDYSKPEGIRDKLLDSSKFNTLIPGWKFTPLTEAIRKTYEWYKKTRPEGETTGLDTTKY